MEIKKLFVLVFCLCLLSGCSFGKKQLVCEKKLKDDNYYYDIVVTSKFDSNKLLIELDSKATYHLTEEGLKEKDTFKKLLEEKNDKYKDNEYIKVSYEITDNEVIVSENIIVDDEFLYKGKDLVSVYLGNERGYKSIKSSFEENHFTCEER